ncbi:DUF2795 domain-containing protein [Microbacterium sp. NPDC089318]
MSPSPALARFLAEMEFPATKDDLLREAARDGLDLDDVLALEQLSGHTFNARRQITDALCAMPAKGALVAA